MGGTERGSEERDRGNRDGGNRDGGKKNIQKCTNGDGEKTRNVEKEIEEGKMERNGFGRDKGDM